MLSTAAFNAFLKTLEEPPKHVIFILATTEKHKIIPTILSRCQIYDFKRIGIDDLKKSLAKIADQLGIPYQDEALQLIAVKADGAMRDALSIFDRMVSFTQKNLTTTDVAANLNILDSETYFQFTDLILQKDIPSLLVLANDILSKGFEGSQFIDGLGNHYRTLLVAKDPQTLPLMEVSTASKENYQTQSQAFAMPHLLSGLQIINETALNYKNSTHKRLSIELCLMQLASLHHQEGEKKKAI